MLFKAWVLVFPNEKVTLHKLHFLCILLSIATTTYSLNSLLVSQISWKYVFLVSFDKGLIEGQQFQ